ncbi:hypothetical protein AAON49_06115 [Pseudotenacibaculum sp. MALMAid0570]|uniref:hypothetical protein n=1 Tax=Pseudotenacibaculum sp. MALMAid0570 TaxID=3143938 RepID=UPI0032DEB91D
MNLSKKSKIILGLLIFVAISVVVVYQYSMRPPAKIETKKVDFTGTSDALLSKVKEDFSVWQDKVVVLTGSITNSDANGVTLSNQIYCQFRDTADVKSFQNNQEIKIKGRVIGYDDLLEELKLDQCIIQQ